MKKRRFLWCVAPVLAAALALTSCSADSTNDGSTSIGPVKVSDGGLTGDPILIGSICSCTGPAAGSVGRAGDVLQSWASWVNDRGGINGHPVKVISYDDEQNPATALAVAKKLVEQDKVVAIVGQTSLVSSSWQSYVAGKGIPVIGGQPVDAPFITDPNFFASGTTLPVLMLGEVAQAKKAGAKTLGVFYCAEIPVCEQLPQMLEPMAEQAGLGFAAEKVAIAAPNYIAPCLTFKDKGVDALFSAVSVEAISRIAASCAQQGYKPVQAPLGTALQKGWAKDPNFEGSIFASSNALYTDESIAAVKDFNDALDKYIPGLRDSADFSSPLLWPWAGGQLFLAAAKTANLSPSSTSADVIKGLRALRDETLDGLAPPLTFPEGRPAFPLCYFTGNTKGGAFHSDNGGKPTCIDEATAAALMKALAPS
ncbi:ABC transporter substrate-binding protein [Streptomyces gardneri]|uniref:ABC transporter substrate-binding protein n=1 Tax=Nocardia TaxID=1817 RepID=UPI001359DAB7|nr:MULTISPECIES: ABC transporter substrate-binding protein [Nocardia]MBF6163691.1 ABC transporter substrate-binding protein [Streptomyces gardneri]